MKVSVWRVVIGFLLIPGQVIFHVISSSTEDATQSSSEDNPPGYLHPQCDRGSCSYWCNDTIRRQNWQDLSRNQLNKTEHTYMNESCECTIDCVIFGDCCDDFFELCLQRNLQTLASDIDTPIDVDNMLRNLIPDEDYVPELLTMFLYKTCQRIEWKNNTTSYWMVSTCSEKFSQTNDSMKCENPELDPLGLVPASLQAYTSIVFKNIFCAQCNGVDKTDVIMWETEALCKTSSNDLQFEEFQDLIRSELCHIFSTPPSGVNPRECDYDVSDICPLYSADGTLSGDSIMCRSYLYKLFTTYNIPVRNYHCAACFTLSSEVLSSMTCTETIPSFHYHGAEVPECYLLSCKHRCNSDEETYRLECSCNAKCIIFGDCCYDYMSECQNSNSSLVDIGNEPRLINTIFEEKSFSTDEVEVIEMGGKNTIKRGKNEMTTGTLNELLRVYLITVRYRRCIAVNRDSPTYWTIDHCPPQNRTLECDSPSKAFNRSLVTPVSYADDSSITFKNIYCAKCHGIGKHKLLPWTIYFVCPNFKRGRKSENELNEDGCTLIVLNELKGQKCFSFDAVVDVEDDASRRQQWCNSYKHPVRDALDNIHRNPHCVNESKLSCARRCFGVCNGNDGLQTGLSILFSFQDNNVQFMKRNGQALKSERVCGFDEVFDFFQGHCTKLMCQRGRVPVEGLCVSNGTLIAERSVQVFPNGSRYRFIDWQIWSEDVLEFESVLQLYQNVSETEEYKDMETLLSLRNITLNADFSRVSGKGHFQVIIAVFAKSTSLYEQLDAIQKMSDMFTKVLKENQIAVFDVTVQNIRNTEDVSCSWGKETELDNSSIQITRNSMFAKDNDALYPLDSVAFILNLNGVVPAAERIWVCRIPLACDPVSYNLSDFNVNGNSLESKSSSQILQNDSYFINGDTVLACHNFSRKYITESQIFFRYDQVQVILTYVTSTVSILSLAITLVVYCILPQLRNLPGRLMMSLSASLLVAQVLLLLIQTPNGVLCKVHAVALHFFWLCSFMWMTMMSVNLAMTFKTTTSQQYSSNPIYSHLKYACVAIGMPFIMVTISALLDFLQVDGIYIGYGMFGTCWIANPRASLFIFACPFAIIMFVNLIAFILTFHGIARTSKLSEGISSTRKRKIRAVIYIKLFVIMGLSWIWAFAAAFTDSSILWYIFIILNGLQGFAIFIGFVCTGKIKDQLLKKFVGEESSTSYKISVTGTS